MKTLLAILLCAITAHAATIPPINLVWSPNPETDLREYRIYWGLGPRAYDTVQSAGLNTRFSITNPAPSTTYYIAVTAVNVWGLESDYSNEVRVTTPDRPQAPVGLDGKMDKPVWDGTTNKTSGAITPRITIPGDPGTKVTARIETPAGAVSRTGTVGTNGLVTFAGRATPPPFTARADLTVASWDPDIQSAAEFR